MTRPIDDRESGQDDQTRQLEACDESADPGNVGRPASTPLSAATEASRRKKVSIEPHPAFLEIKRVQAEEEREFKRMKIELREQEIEIRTQEVQLLKRKTASERKESEVRIQATTAKAEKLRQEAEHWRVQTNATLLRERKKLSDDGVSQHDIDMLLPLPGLLQNEVE
jgi:hypothetical protein